MRLNPFIIPAMLLFWSGLQASEPEYSIGVSGGVTDLVVSGELAYVATDNGKVDVVNWKKNSRLQQLQVPAITDFMGDLQQAKIHSVDVAANGCILLVSQGEQGFRDVYIHRDEALEKVIGSASHKMMVKKARFVDDNLILMGLLSSELLLYDLRSKVIVYQVQLSTSTFSDFQLNEELSVCAVSDESGVIRLVNAYTGVVTRELRGENVDNVYQLDFRSGMVIGAGQDRRVSVYSTRTGTSFYLQSDFLVYSVGLSPSGARAAYQANDNNDIQVFEMADKTISNTLIGHHTSITKIVFLTEEMVLTAGDEPWIHCWKI